MAQADLDFLSKSYPHVSIPAENQLMIIIYEKTTQSVKPIQKYVLSIQNITSDKFQISYEKRNTSVSNKRKYLKNKSDENKTVGFFTEQLKYRKNSRLSRKSNKKSDQQ